MPEAEVLKDQPFEGDVRTPKGDIRKRKFRLRTVGIKRQALSVPGESQAEAESGGSKADPLEKLYSDGKLIRPPYNLNELAILVEKSNVLQECLDAMSVNVGGFGYLHRPRMMPDKVKEKFKDEIEEEKILLDLFWESICSDYSFVEARKRLRRDIEGVGNGYLELIETRDGTRIAEIHQIPGHSVRLGRVSDEEVEFSFYRVNPINNWQVEAIKRKKRFRNYVQVDESGKKLVWFKEWRDPRVMNCRTGEYEGDEGVGKIPEEHQASSLKHFKIYSGRSPYGIPRYVGRYPAIEGSRKSEEINFFTMGSNMVPSCFICVEDGELVEDSIARLQELVETHVGEDLNYSKFIILEAESTIEDPMPGQSGKARIRVEPMTKVQQKDQLFQDYDLNNQNKIRQAWRIPPIFIGRCHTSDTEYLTSDGWLPYEQVRDEMALGTVNQATGEVEFQKMDARHSYQYDGPILELENRGVNAGLTPNHNLLTRPAVAKNRAQKTWELVEARDLKAIANGNGGHIELPVSAAWKGEDREVFTMPRNDPSNSWDPSKKSKNRKRDLSRYYARRERDVPIALFLEFLGFFVSEGSTTKVRGPITLSQNKGKIADRMIEVLRQLGFDPMITNSRQDELNISFCHVGLWGWLRKNCGHKASEKKLPDWVLSLPTYRLEIVLRTLIDGDGSQGAFSYSTTSKKLNGQLHEICVKIGFALTTRTYDREGWNRKYISYGHRDQRHLLHPQKHVETKHYRGKVSCFSVPNGLLITKRNGRVLISGNSDDYTRATADSSRKIGDEQVYAPEREPVDWFCNQVNMSFGARFHLFKTRTPNVTDNMELVKAMGIAEKSGGMTPRRANVLLEDIFDGTIGPLPEEIDPDVPYSLQFAWAQNAGKMDDTQSTNRSVEIDWAEDYVREILRE